MYVYGTPESIRTSYEIFLSRPRSRLSPGLRAYVGHGFPIGWDFANIGQDRLESSNVLKDYIINFDVAKNLPLIFL